MTRTYHDIKIVEDGYTHRCKSGSVELENGAVYSTHTTTAQNLVNRFGVAKYVGNKYQLDRDEEDYTIKKVVDEEETADGEDGITLNEYVRDATATQLKDDIDNIEEDMSEFGYEGRRAYLKALKREEQDYKDRVTVVDAIDDKIEELEE